MAACVRPGKTGLARAPFCAIYRAGPHLKLKLPSPLGQFAAGSGFLGETALVWVLRRLPPSLWLSDAPQDLALAEESIVLE